MPRSVDDHEHVPMKKWERQVPLWIIAVTFPIHAILAPLYLPDGIWPWAVVLILLLAILSWLDLILTSNWVGDWVRRIQQDNAWVEQMWDDR